MFFLFASAVYCAAGGEHGKPIAGARRREQGRYDEAADLYRRTIDLRRRLLGDEHPHVALTIHNFSALQLVRGEYQEAAATPVTDWLT